MTAYITCAVEGCDDEATENVVQETGDGYSVTVKIPVCMDHVSAVGFGLTDSDSTVAEAFADN
jgi:hypothetical protein